MNRNKFILYGAFLLMVVFQMHAQEERNFIPSQNDKFNYTGRVDFSNQDFARFDWPATSVDFTFQGKWTKIYMKGGESNYFNLFVDGRLDKVVHSKMDTVIKILGLRNEPTKVSLFKRTEGGMGQTVFYGVEISPGAELLSSQKIKTRKIEFIGNSITAGYGTEGKSKEEKFKPTTENVWKSYACITAQAFDAQAHVLAHSGLGVVRNYGDKKKVSTKLAPMPERFDQILDTDDKTNWDFNSWQPDAVVINLGTNDFSTTPHPEKVIFQHGYEKLLRDIRDQYGNIPIFCLSGPMLEKPAYGYIRETVKKIQIVNSDKNIYFIGIPAALLDENTDLGSDYHPSFQGQQKIARHIIPVIATVLEWDYTIPYSKL